MPLPRKKTFVLAREASKLGPYDERPMLPDTSGTQVCLSRNDRQQPFFLICEKDTLIVTFAGTGKIEFKDTGVNYFPLEPGDHIYVPGGAPTRLTPDTECLIMRYKAREPGLEGVAWYCESCGTELYRHVFDTATTHPQEGYLAGCAAFNADDGRRSCATCSAIHPPVDVAAHRWAQLAGQLR
jgi:hypothetical protein